jgi:hypothetical protein
LSQKSEESQTKLTKRHYDKISKPADIEKKANSSVPKGLNLNDENEDKV